MYLFLASLPFQLMVVVFCLFLLRWSSIWWEHVKLQV